jgi:CelD/BcsL family acetyltransferase involved in cellulose biosynthesis
VYGSFEQVAPLKEAWNDLSVRAGDLFASYDWCEVWWRHFGKGRRLEIHTLRQGQRLAAVLPLFRETLRVGIAPLRTVRLVGCDYTLDAAGLAIEADVAGAFLTTILTALADREPWDVLHLGPLRSYATVSEPLAEAGARHWQVQAVLAGRQNDWLTSFDLPGTYEAYLQGLQGDERRDTLRRFRQLQEQHDRHLEAVRHPEQVQPAMDILIKWHQALWVGKGQRGQFVDWPGFEQFHRDVAQRMAERGQLLLVTLTIDGQPLGAAYGYHFGHRSHTMIRGYGDDAPWRRYALGRLLHCHMVQEAVNRGSSLLDDGRGVFEYKLRLGGQLHGERSITIVRKGRTARLRLWLAMRAAYLVHAVYCRIWFDGLAPRLGVVRPLRHLYVRTRFLAQLFQRSRFGLLAGQRLQELSRVAAPSMPGRAPQTHTIDENSNQ